jgi:hypothetical protein
MTRRVATVPAGLLALLLALALAAALLRPEIAAAQRAPRYEVTGFRDARFGMTELEVRELARKSFGVDDGRMTLTGDKVSGATKLIVHVEDLEPGLGEGRVEYLFGYEHQRLYQVNVVWGRDTNPQFDNLAMLEGALRLQRYFLGFAWESRSAPSGALLGDRAIRLFGGVDARKRTVSLTIEDVLYEPVFGNIRMVPEVSVPTILTVSYMDENREGDVDRITRSEF